MTPEAGRRRRPASPPRIGRVPGRPDRPFRHRGPSRTSRHGSEAGTWPFFTLIGLIRTGSKIDGRNPPADTKSQHCPQQDNYSLSRNTGLTLILHELILLATPDC